MEPNTEADARPLLRDAQIVLGHDWASGRDFLVYGRTWIERIIRDGTSRAMVTVKIGLDQETDELEKLLALVVTLKGRHDYMAG